MTITTTTTINNNYNIHDYIFMICKRFCEIHENIVLKKLEQLRHIAVNKMIKRLDNAMYMGALIE